MPMTTAGVTLVMPMYNEAADIADVLATLEAQTYAHAAMRLVVVDGGSTDGSAETVRGWFDASDIAGEVVLNPRRKIPSSLNIGIALADPADIIVRLDAHTLYAPDYVATLVGALAATPSDIGCVGGAVIPEHDGSFGQRLVAALYTNPVGLGGADHRFRNEPRVVQTVYMGAWRPGVLQRVGGFDERWEANEDSELSARLRAHGYRTWWVPVRHAYRVKRGPLAAVRQWGRYGFWRAQTVRRHRTELRLRHLAPPLALAFAALLLLTPLRFVDLIFFALYSGAVFAKRRSDEPFAVTLASCVFFPACQGAWGIGLVRGFLSGLDRRAIDALPARAAG